VQQLGLTVFAFTVDHGLKGAAVYKNIQAVVDTLGVDHGYIPYDLTDAFRDALSRNKRPCGTVCRHARQYYYAVARLKGVDTVLTGGDLPKGGQVVIQTQPDDDRLERMGLGPLESLCPGREVREKLQRTRLQEIAEVRLNAALLLNRSRVDELVAQLPWVDPGYMYDTDCPLPAISLERMYQKSGHEWSNVFNGTVEATVLLHFARFVRHGLVSRQDMLDMLHRPPCTPEAVWREVHEKIGPLPDAAASS
jgi:hypothetical protein